MRYKGEKKKITLNERFIYLFCIMDTGAHINYYISEMEPMTFKINFYI